MQEDALENTFRNLQKLELKKHPNKIVTSKYNIITFLPFNLIHQLSKPSTLFFFITAILICVPAISPFEPWSYIIAFCIVIGVSIIKDAVEDYNRHCNDRIINERTCQVIETEEGANILKDKMIMDLKQGDWICVNRDEEVCADVIFIRGVVEKRQKERSKKQSAREETARTCTNFCFVDTQNIDGESNLKKRATLLPVYAAQCSNYEEAAQNLCSCVSSLHSSTGQIKLKDTGDSFGDFHCEVDINGHNHIATERNALLRGTILRNTDRVICIVVGVGQNTKQGIGVSKVRKKKSIFEKRMDYLLLLVAILYVIILSATTLFGLFMVYVNENTKYILNRNGFTEVVCLLFTNYILYSYLVPLSLYVMVEVARFFHAQYVSYDTEMKVDGVKSACNNSNVIEDLGMIDYVLTDKTGTITKNSMTFRALHLPGSNDLISVEDMFRSPQEPNYHNDLIILNILICNSIEVLDDEYQGISQDELCFLKILSEYGYVLLERDSSFVRIRIKGEEKKVHILYTVEFTSRRQYMSVIVEYGGRYFLFTKGSDQRLLNIHREADTIRVVNNAGDYRSLVLRYKELSQEEAAKLQDGQHKEEFVAAQNNTRYLCTTFIEDELQDGVAETMSLLHRAGIRVWMITGDKQETAVCCARNAGIIGRFPYKEMEGKEVVRILECLVNSEDPEESDGENSPFMAYNTAQTERRLTESIPNVLEVESLIIYRATPSQKGRIAMLMGKAEKHILAIGDGNNDVAMLRGAHVGVGIMGKEGTQASATADFAIPQFSLLRNLILIHGRYNLIRYSKISLNAFYKNILFIFVQFFFNFANGASGMSIYNDFFMNYYNLFFTSLIPFSIALFDRDTGRRNVLGAPDSYRMARAHFSRKLICANILFGVVEACIIYAMVFSFMHLDICGASGLLGGYGSVSTLASIFVFYAAILRQYRLISFTVWYSYAALGLSIFFMLCLVFGLQDILTKSNSVTLSLLTMPVTYVIVAGLGCFILFADVFFEVLCEGLLIKAGYESN